MIVFPQFDPVRQPAGQRGAGEWNGEKRLLQRMYHRGNRLGCQAKDGSEAAGLETGISGFAQSIAPRGAGKQIWGFSTEVFGWIRSSTFKPVVQSARVDWLR